MFYPCVFEELPKRPQTRRGNSPLAEHLQGSRFVETHRILQLLRLNPRVHLRRLKPRMPEQSTDLFQIVMLTVDLHRDAVAEIVRLELGVAESVTTFRVRNLAPGWGLRGVLVKGGKTYQPAVGLAKAPEVLAAHRQADSALTRAAPARPEERRVRRERSIPLCDEIRKSATPADADARALPG